MSFLKHWLNSNQNADGFLSLNYFEKWNNTTAQIFALGITNVESAVGGTVISKTTKIAETFAAGSQMYSSFQV